MSLDLDVLAPQQEESFEMVFKKSKYLDNKLTNTIWDNLREKLDWKVVVYGLSRALKYVLFREVSYQILVGIRNDLKEE